MLVHCFLSWPNNKLTLFFCNVLCVYWALTLHFSVSRTDSFSSGFHMVRAGQCPYLYMCAHQFTVLFRAAGTAGQKQMHALLTPTSRGFREAIKCEGNDNLSGVYSFTFVFHSLVKLSLVRRVIIAQNSIHHHKDHLTTSSALITMG